MHCSAASEPLRDAHVAHRGEASRAATARSRSERRLLAPRRCSRSDSCRRGSRARRTCGSRRCSCCRRSTCTTGTSSWGTRSSASTVWSSRSRRRCPRILRCPYRAIRRRLRHRSRCHLPRQRGTHRRRGSFPPRRRSPGNCSHPRVVARLGEASRRGQAARIAAPRRAAGACRDAVRLTARHLEPGVVTSARHRIVKRGAGLIDAEVGRVAVTGVERRAEIYVKVGGVVREVASTGGRADLPRGTTKRSTCRVHRRASAAGTGAGGRARARARARQTAGGSRRSGVVPAATRHDDACERQDSGEPHGAPSRPQRSLPAQLEPRRYRRCRSSRCRQPQGRSRRSRLLVIRHWSLRSEPTRP